MAELRITTGNQLAAIFNANPFRGEKAKWLTALDFFPDDRIELKGSEQDINDQIEFISKIMKCGPGKPGSVN